MEAPPLPEAPPASNVPPQAPLERGARVPLYRQPAAVIAAIAIVLAAAQWYDSRHRVGRLQQELAVRLTQADTQSKEGRKVTEQISESTRDAQVKLGVLEAKLAESQNQQIALEALYQELSRSRDESLLADVEQTLVVANQQLQVAGNVKAALIALQAADARLARLDRLQLVSLRKVIARDIERLKLAPFVDVVGMSARLDNLIMTVDTLPLAMELRPTAPVAAAKDNATETNVWARLTREFWHDLRSLVRIQQMDRPDVPLLAPGQTYFLRENLKLRLLSARLALLAHDETSFKDDLRAVREWLNRYYDAGDKSVAAVLAIVRQLSENKISIEVPDLNSSLETVRNYRLTRERSR